MYNPTALFAEATYTYSTSASSSGSPVPALITGLGGYIISSVLLAMVFKKAGRPAWAGFVPFYNSWLLLEMGGRSGKNIFWVFLPFIGSIIYLVQYIRAMLVVGRKFGKSDVFSVVGLVIFSLVGYAILAFGKSTYSDAQGSDPTAFNQPQPPTAAI